MDLIWTLKINSLDMNYNPVWGTVKYENKKKMEFKGKKTYNGQLED
jgi:hypothetical protein